MEGPTCVMPSPPRVLRAAACSRGCRPLVSASSEYAETSSVVAQDSREVAISEPPPRASGGANATLCRRASRRPSKRGKSAAATAAISASSRTSHCSSLRDDARSSTSLSVTEGETRAGECRGIGAPSRRIVPPRFRHQPLDLRLRPLVLVGQCHVAASSAPALRHRPGDAALVHDTAHQPELSFHRHPSQPAAAARHPYTADRRSPRRRRQARRVPCGRGRLRRRQQQQQPFTPDPQSKAHCPVRKTGERPRAVPKTKGGQPHGQQAAHAAAAAVQAVRVSHFSISFDLQKNGKNGVREA